MSSKTLKASVIIGGSISGAFKSALSQTKNGLKQIGDEIVRVERRQRQLAASVDYAQKMGRNVAGLRREYVALEHQADRLRRAQSRLADVQARIDANNAKRRALGGQLRSAATQFGVVTAAAFMPVREAVKFETAMLGIVKQVDGARDAAGNLTPVYFQMRKQIQGLGHDLPIATNDIADMVTAGARMGIVKDELIGFVKSTAIMATAFDAMPAEIADSMGKIAKIFRIPIPAIGELGDVINYLDDNAIAKGSDIIRVMQGDLAGAATTMGLSAKNAAALASTFLTLGESAERADTAAAGMLRQLQVAKMNPKRFQVGVKMLGLTADQLQKGMIADPQKMILDVLGRIKKLPQEQQMEAVTRLFGKDWGGAIAKLANGVEEYRRQLELANGEQAKGSMSREFQSRMKTTGAQWQVMKNRVSELAVNIGSALLPAINGLLKAAGPMVERFADWSERNPGAVKGVIGLAVGLSGLRVAVIGARLAWATLASPVLKVAGFIARFRAAKTIGELGRMGMIAARVGGVLRTVGAAIAAIGGGPIAIAVAALTVGALVVRKYWQPIAAWITGVFEGIRAAVGPAFAELGAALAPLKPVWDGITGAVSSAWNWFMKLLEPVNMTQRELKKAGDAGRNFGSVIGGVMAFVVRSITGVVNAIKWVINNMGKVARFAGMLPGVGPIGTLLSAGASLAGRKPAAAPAGLPAPVRGRAAPPAPPMARRGGSNVTVHQSNTFHLTQQAGESADSFARRVAAHTKDQEAIARRGSLVDGAG